MPTQVAPTQQNVVEKTCEYIVPEVYPTHTHFQTNHVYKHVKSFPQTTSYDENIYNQQFVEPSTGPQVAGAMSPQAGPGYGPGAMSPMAGPGNGSQVAGAMSPQAGPGYGPGAMSPMAGPGYGPGAMSPMAGPGYGPQVAGAMSPMAGKGKKSCGCNRKF
jgi:spore coat protein D